MDNVAVVFLSSEAISLANLWWENARPGLEFNLKYSESNVYGMITACSNSQDLNFIKFTLDGFVGELIVPKHSSVEFSVRASQ